MKQLVFENIVGKRENAGNQHFLLFLQRFLTLSQTETLILATLNLSSANAFNLVKAKILSFGKELNVCPKYGIIIFYFRLIQSEKGISTSLIKHLRVKKKTLITKYFFFSYNVFYNAKDKIQSLNHIYTVACKSFQVGSDSHFVPWGRMKDTSVVKQKEF